jgi:DNA primase
VVRLPAGEDPDDVLSREGPARLASAVDEAPDYLTWLLEDVRPSDAGLSSTEKRERVGRILEILGAVPDRILRYEEYRKLAQEVGVPLDILWGGEKANLRPENTRSISVGTAGNEQALSAMALPKLEHRLLQVLVAGGELNSLILSTLNDELLTDPRARRVVSALRRGSEASEPVDFQRQIADLTEEERTFLSGIALEDSPEPTEKDVDGLLKALEIRHLKGESAALQTAITQAEAGGSSGSELNELMRARQEKERLIAKLKSRKGNELGD